MLNARGAFEQSVTAVRSRWSQGVAMRVTTGTLTFSIDAEVFRRFPELRVGALMVTGLERAAASLAAGETRAAWTRAAERLTRRGVSADDLPGGDAIREWRLALASCGVDPSTHVTSVEANARRALLMRTASSTVPIVDFTRAIAAGHLAPLSGHDIDALPSPFLTLRAARPATDWFVPLGARSSELPLLPAIVVYAAGRTVLAWSFNHRESRQTCVHEGTGRAVFFTEALTAAQAGAAAQLLDELRRVLEARGARASPPIFAHEGAADVALPVEDGLLTLDTDDDVPRFTPGNPGGERTR